MSGDELFKYSWRAYEVIEYHNHSNTLRVQCAILAIDFECHSMKLIPIADIGFEEKEFWCSIDLIDRIKKNQKLTIS